ncbi:BTAD domain-containing putative transcriptional regulator [Sphaerisporangium rubeum]|uniref:DNA-binding SARP family transcriptional activator n=1 Tax=Sphaerisporangium rubeum TaxID=321317 RepID=A0A7X0IHW5_9ACTN|nr:AfsR/SARP family transcriptional regulator [Sphaerisporangium rubeum]MBB6474298.1 DNA-binding SARP family transcriptional activator [Sphaerisporangium rubeum]
MAELRFHLLGPLRVWLRETEIKISSDKQRAVLALLLLKAGTPVRRQEIIDAVWGDDAPDSVINLVQTYVGRLRRRIDPGDAARSGSSWLTGLGAAYAIRPDRCDADLAAFRAAVASARQAGSPHESLQLMLDGLKLWQGPCLSDLDHVLKGHPWVRAVDQERINVLLEAARTALRLGLATEVLPQLRAVAEAEPLNEAVQSWLVLALAASGAQAEALAEYDAARARLADELGIDPGPQLRAAHMQVLRQEAAPPSYDAAPATGTLRPSLLPAGIGDFTGREKLVEHLCATLTGRAGEPLPVTLITGQAGVGKTTLAVHVAHRMSEAFPDGQLYADLRATEASPADPARVLSRFLRALGVHASAIPEDIDERVDLYRSQLAGRRVLVVLDDAAGQSHVRRLLPGSPTCSVIVTSRCRQSGRPGARTVDLDVLTPGEAGNMLAAIVGEARCRAEPGAAAELVRLCGGLPLGVRAAGTRLATRPHWTLGHFAERFSDGGLDELVLKDLDVRATLAVGYRRSSDAARRAFRLLGVLDLPSFSACTAASTLDTSPDLAEELIDALTDERLLEVAGTDAGGRTRYRFHELVRLYARERAAEEETETSVRTVVTRTLATLLALSQEADGHLPGSAYTPVRGRAPRWPQPGPTHEWLIDNPVAWFDSERAALVAAVRQAAATGQAELAWELAASLLNAAVRRGFWNELEESHRVALMACRCTDNRLGEAVMMRGLAELEHTLGHHTACADALRAAHTIFADLRLPAPATEALARLRALRQATPPAPHVPALRRSTV